MLRTMTEFSIAFHLHTNSQTKVVNKSLRNLLRTLVREHVGSWDLKLFIAEFLYNSFVNKTTDKSMHEIVYDFRFKQPIDLILMADHYKISEGASSFASHVNELHTEINHKIVKNNANYKLRTNFRKRLKTFNFGDFVMFRFVRNGFP